MVYICCVVTRSKSKSGFTYSECLASIIRLRKHYTDYRCEQEALRQGLIPSDEVVSIDSSEANQLTSAGAKLWGQNSRGKAIRARKLLGWKPKECTFEEEIPHAVTSEAEKLGLIKGHAAKVSR